MIYKNLFLVFLLSLLYTHEAYTQKSITVEGETLRYRAYYGFVTAGYAQFTSSDIIVGGKTLVNANIDFQTSNLVEKLFKIHYQLEGSYTKRDNLPEEASYLMIEGNKSWADKTIYNRQRKYLRSENNGELFFENEVRDLTSAISYIRAINWDNHRVNDTLSIDVYFKEHDIFPLKIIYKGKETISTELGKIACIKLNPTSDPGKLFNGKSTINIWFSDDENKIPILVSTEVLVGSFKFELIKFENLKHLLLFE